MIKGDLELPLKSKLEPVSLLVQGKSLDELALFLSEIAEGLRLRRWPNAGATIRDNHIEIRLDGDWDDV